LSSGRDDWEVVGLDLEIPKLLLDVHRGEIDQGFDGLLDEWHKYPACWLAIQPFITDMQVWEIELPRSAIDAVVLHLSKEGLRLVTAAGSAIKRNFDVRQVRATGDRLVPVAANDEARVRALRDAFAVGAGYVELRDPGGGLRAKASNRLLNLDEGVIAPMACVPSQFSRLDSQGRCPMCLGSRGVTAMTQALVIGNEGASPDSEGFLTVEANAILKGVRRNDLTPFLRRLAKEGLWDLETSFKRLNRKRQELILFGFWSRPGAGSFLKTSQSNPFEVSSWLRWDGLYRHILAQAERSRHAEWVRRLREGAHTIPCIRCGGSGLQHFASLLSIGDAPFTKWVRLSDTRRMLSLLNNVEPHTPRQQRTRERILHCLAPIAHSMASTLTVIERAVESFSTMETAKSGDLGES
jgi:excinuclease UvrABC ATPase subunit